MDRREEDTFGLYAEMLHAFRAHILSFCYRHGRDATDADQLLVAISNAMLNGIASLRADSSPKERNRWLHRLMHHAYADHRRAHPPVVPLDHALDIAVESDTDAELIESLLQHLDPDERAFLQERLAGYTPAEQSAMHRISRDAVYQRYHRIVQKLKNIYIQHYE